MSGCRTVGVNSVTDNSSRNRRRSEQRADLKKLCQSFEAMSARSYMDSIIPFLSQGEIFYVQGCAEPAVY